MNYWAKITGIIVSGLPHTGQAEIILRNFKAKIQIKLKKEGFYVFLEEIKIDPFQFELYTRGVVDWAKTSFGVGFGEAFQEYTKTTLTEVTSSFIRSHIFVTFQNRLMVIYLLIFFNLCLLV